MRITTLGQSTLKGKTKTKKSKRKARKTLDRKGKLDRTNDEKGKRKIEQRNERQTWTYQKGKSR